MIFIDDSLTFALADFVDSPSYGALASDVIRPIERYF